MSVCRISPDAFKLIARVIRFRATRGSYASPRHATDVARALRCLDYQNYAAFMQRYPTVEDGEVEEPLTFDGYLEFYSGLDTEVRDESTPMIPADLHVRAFVARLEYNLGDVLGSEEESHSLQCAVLGALNTLKKALFGVADNELALLLTALDPFDL